MEAQEISSQDQDGLADVGMENLGESEGNHGSDKDTTPPREKPTDGEGSQSAETLAVQKRLKAARRAHDREVRELHARIGELESRMTQPNQSHSQDQTVNPYSPPMDGGIEQHIHKAVSIALQHKEMEERKAHEAQQAAHVHRQYGELQKHLDSMGDKYDDFHDIVFGHDTPFTPAMRDYSMTLPKSGSGSAGEVLYKLGKNPTELQRIAKLHPLEQASEMARLSHALISGGESKNSQSRPPLGNIKNNPVVNSHVVTDKTPVSELRQRMKAGWK